MNKREQYLEQYLSWFWLRPENALMSAIRAEKYASTFKYFDSDSLDVSCGDGVFSFIAAGGGLSVDSDMFRSIDNTEPRQGNFDAFDFYDDSYVVDVVKRPEFTFSHGSDWKKNLIRKAERLEWYSNLFLHDNNQPIPFDNGSFGYIYSNSAYWVDRFEKHINDLVRLLKPGGCLILEAKTKNIENYSSNSYASEIIGKKACDILDAGRRSTWKGLRGIEQYREIFGKMKGVDLIEESPVYGDLMVQVWDIGLRPLFNPLSRMANSVDEQTRREVKKEWVQTLYDLSKYFVNNYEAENDSAVEYLFVLRKGA